MNCGLGFRMYSALPYKIKNKPPKTNQEDISLGPGNEGQDGCPTPDAWRGLLEAHCMRQTATFVVVEM